MVFGQFNQKLEDRCWYRRQNQRHSCVNRFRRKNTGGNGADKFIRRRRLNRKLISAKGERVRMESKQRTSLSRANANVDSIQGDALNEKLLQVTTHRSIFQDLFIVRGRGKTRELREVQLFGNLISKRRASLLATTVLMKPYEKYYGIRSIAHLALYCFSFPEKETTGLTHCPAKIRGCFKTSIWSDKKEKEHLTFSSFFIKQEQLSLKLVCFSDVLVSKCFVSLYHFEMWYVNFREQCSLLLLRTPYFS